MGNKTDKNKEETQSLLEKSRALREKSKATETKFNELKAQVDEFIHADKSTEDAKNI
ncbi:hypothetical protein [Pedobacter chitinilyticus]|jgi:hypothetical protein|uniref:hypothetical protein n=1 Tax=Pedobacter chitinilyticus TaxID=2233776 RepID=UPI0013C43BE5|nr:hypothetical protein [Pedobacter chitinilyticus]